MRTIMTENTLYDICSGFVLERSSSCCHFFPRHTLVYLYSGRLHLRNQCGETLNIKSGDSAFIDRGSHLYLYAEPEMDRPCHITFFSLSYQFLCSFYQTLDETQRGCSGNPLPALHILSHRPDIKSFFHSLTPYFQCVKELSPEIARLKMAEAAYALLNIDKRYADTLFDFTCTCKMNIFDLLAEYEERGFVWKELQYDYPNNIN
ncbi:MAG: AraC family transcriptional regulator [Phocaeicola dorei]|nr:AraC family transcriptional regulator [Phocaeicola dorei]